MPRFALTEEPPPAAYRLSAKAVVLDPGQRVLLVHMRDPTEPAAGDWWELPGGGPQTGETLAAAVVREVAEETGVELPLERVAPWAWERTATFCWLGRRRWQREYVHLVRLAGPPRTGPVNVTEEEAGSWLGFDWWSTSEIAGFGGRFYPGRLPELLPRLLAGERVVEAFERWN